MAVADLDEDLCVIRLLLFRGQGKPEPWSAVPDEERHDEPSMLDGQGSQTVVCPCNPLGAPFLDAGLGFPCGSEQIITQERDEGHGDQARGDEGCG